jgi:hypothetical protein
MMLISATQMPIHEHHRSNSSYPRYSKVQKFTSPVVAQDYMMTKPRVKR